MRPVTAESLLPHEELCDECGGHRTVIVAYKARHSAQLEQDEATVDCQRCDGVGVVVHEQRGEDKAEMRATIQAIDEAHRDEVARAVRFVYKQLDEAREELARIKVTLALEDLILIQQETRK